MKKWSDTKKKIFSPARIAKNQAAVEKAVMEMDLRALRAASGKTQVELAPLIAMTQSELSRFERRADHRVSMLNKYVRALGGTVKIVAKLRNKTFTIAEG